MEAFKHVEHDGRIITRKLNVLSDADIASLVSQIGSVDVLFNCAGCVYNGSIIEMHDDDLDAADYVSAGIRCNAICPGTVESPSLQQRLRDQGDYEVARAAFIARQPIGRIGQPQEIADLAVYLASATYTTGQTYNIDVSWTI